MGFPIKTCHVIPDGDWHPWVNPTQISQNWRQLPLNEFPLTFPPATAMHLQFVHNDILGWEEGKVHFLIGILKGGVVIPRIFPNVP